MWSDEEIKGKILHKLTRMGKFKASHTAIDNLPKGFPKDVRDRIKTLVKETRKFCLKDKILCCRIKLYFILQ